MQTLHVHLVDAAACGRVLVGRRVGAVESVAGELFAPLAPVGRPADGDELFPLDLVDQPLEGEDRPIRRASV